MIKLILVFFISYGINIPISQTSVRSDKKKVDWIAFHSNFLNSKGITDLTKDGLIFKLNNIKKDTSSAYHIILLLARKEVKKAIPSIEKWLHKNNITVQIAAAEALLMLNNFNGLEKLKEICKNHKSSYALDASSVLARYGFIEAIPCLKEIAKNDIYSYRLSVLNSLKNLVENLDKKKNNYKKEKIKSLISYIISFLTDEDIRIRNRTSNILTTLNIANKKIIIIELKKIERLKNNSKFLKQIQMIRKFLEKT